ncbi:hypothetical protein J4437_02955 [Candidatus Woesearchaeota archaeon]|nr:hypothetical protein [Candidatus Woesearchaeota archaeon]
MTTENKTLEELTALLLKAQEIKTEGQTDNKLAKALRMAANNHFGSQSRTSEFIQALDLAREIEPKVEKIWSKDYSIIAEGKLPIQENIGFKLETYLAGKSELSLDCEVKRRLYGLGLSTGVDLRFGNTYFEYDPNTGNKHVKKKMAEELGNTLRRKIKSDLPKDKSNNFFLLIGEPYSCQETTVSFGNRDEEPGIFEIDFTTKELLEHSLKEHITKLSQHLSRLYTNGHY